MRRRWAGSGTWAAAERGRSVRHIREKEPRLTSSQSLIRKVSEGFGTFGFKFLWTIGPMPLNPASRPVFPAPRPAPRPPYTTSRATCHDQLALPASTMRPHRGEQVLRALRTDAKGAAADLHRGRRQGRRHEGVGHRVQAGRRGTRDCMHPHPHPLVLREPPWPVPTWGRAGLRAAPAQRDGAAAQQEGTASQQCPCFLPWAARLPDCVLQAAIHPSALPHMSPAPPCWSWPLTPAS